MQSFKGLQSIHCNVPQYLRTPDLFFFFLVKFEELQSVWYIGETCENGSVLVAAGCWTRNELTKCEFFDVTTVVD